MRSEESLASAPDAAVPPSEDAAATPSGLRDFCLERLSAFRQRLRDEPSVNPVAQLAFQLSRQLEVGEIGVAQLTELVEAIGRDALQDRARAILAKVGEIDPEANRAALRKALETLAAVNGDSGRRVARKTLALVFTAHPTFALSRTLRHQLAEAVGRAAAGEDTADKAPPAWTGPVGPDAPITLSYEHEDALRAIDAAKDALFEAARIAAGLRRDSGDADWHSAAFGTVGLGTWIGYDLDGRTDIRWIDSFRFRLEEKLIQLRRYETIARRIAAGSDAGAAAQPLTAFADRIAAAAAYLGRRIDAFPAEALDAERLSAAANVLTADHPDKLTDPAPLIAELEPLIAATEGPAAIDIAALRSEMLNFGLGVAEIHIRINATQLHNAIRRHVDFEVEETMAGRSSLERLDALVRDMKPVAVNFASLDRETTTALRQFILASQIVKHVDSRASIRLLIAECESPITVLCALYFARMLGLERHMDVSPLFETPRGLENAARFFEVLFSAEAYTDAVRIRGRLCVQTGFSDSGRFMGQIPAALAIERLHGQLARAVVKHGLTDVEVLTFETHGESAGRGGHPGTMLDRMLYLLSPWARAGFEKRGIALAHEVSFQGGDGYLYFETPALALATVTRLLESEAAWRDHATAADEIYEQTNFSFDFFRRMAAYHARLLTDPAYHRVLGTFANGLLNETGSRKARRQFDIAGEQADQVRRVRAIPHNALLQQLGYPLNVLAGFGTALAGDEDRFGRMLTESERLRRLTAVVVHIRRRSSIKALIAYATLFDPNYWVNRPYGGAETHLTEPCLFIAQLLERDDRAAALTTLGVQMRVDVIRLHRTLEAAGIQIEDRHEAVRERLDLLHAVRLALLQHIFLLAAKVPRFSTRNDISREDIIRLIFSLRVGEAVDLLRDAYPVNAADPRGYRLDEPATYPDERASGYAAIVGRMIDPMLDAHRTVLEIGAIVSLDFGAHG
jgi:phosphoenolpyruvate carboxylase